jgi:hypothetical protein
MSRLIDALAVLTGKVDLPMLEAKAEYFKVQGAGARAQVETLTNELNGLKREGAILAAKAKSDAIAEQVIDEMKHKPLPPAPQLGDAKGSDPD